MKKRQITQVLSAFILLIASGISYADDDFGGETPGVGGVALKDLMNKDKSNIACEGNICKIFSVSVNRRKFTIGANVGYGSSSGSSMGGVVVGGAIGGTGTGVGIGDGSYGGYYGSYGGYGGYGASAPYASVYINWEDVKCAKNINVDRSVYDAVTTYMKSLKNPDGTTRPTLNPSEQAMILFYETLIKLTEGFTC